MNDHVDIIVGAPGEDRVPPRCQIGNTDIIDKWYEHLPAREDRPFKTLGGIKRSITNEWNGDTHRYVAVITPMSDGTFKADVARLRE